MDFEITDTYIELYKLLKATGLCETGGMAKNAISEGLVRVNGQTDFRKRCKLRPGEKVEFQDQTVMVTRKT